MRLFVPTVLLVACLWAGCADEQVACSMVPMEQVRFEGWDSTDAQHPWQTLVTWPGDVTSDSLLTTRIGAWTVLTAPPGVSGVQDLQLTGADCSGEAEVDIQQGPTGAVVAPGAGAIVRTAGFWTNGTLFYTNMQEVEDTWEERASWYVWGGADPLQVYVYDQDRSEMPRHWGDPDRDLGALPVSGMRLPTEYSTTIRGFNEALKGLATSTVAVAHLAPEEGYTLEGYEDHPLYGDELVFIIKVDAVADVPCPWDATAPGCFRR